MGLPPATSEAVFPNPSGLRRSLLAWYASEGRDLPWRHTQEPYAIWVSEVMLQQTQVRAVIPYYQRWLERFPNMTALAVADLQDILKAWEGLGYYARAQPPSCSSRDCRQPQRYFSPRARRAPGPAGYRSHDGRRYSERRLRSAILNFGWQCQARAGTVDGAIGAASAGAATALGLVRSPTRPRATPRFQSSPDGLGGNNLSAASAKL